MKHVNFGNAALTAGNIGIGTLTWGRDTELEDARQIAVAMLEAGGDFIDLSPIYGEGEATPTFGELLTNDFSRDEFILCLHTGYQITRTNIRHQISRSAIRKNLETTLATLNTDYVDLLLVDFAPGFENTDELCQTLEEIAARGNANYFGLYNWPAWLAATVCAKLDSRTRAKIIALGSEYSLLHRLPESQLHQLAKFQGSGILAYSPLAGGVLTGKYRNTIPPTSRAATQHLAPLVQPYLDARPRQLVEAVTKAADGLGRTPSEIAITWALSQPQMSVAICGPRTGMQGEQLFQGNYQELPEQVLAVLNEITAI